MENEKDINQGNTTLNDDTSSITIKSLFQRDTGEPKKKFPVILTVLLIVAAGVLAAFMFLNTEKVSDRGFDFKDGVLTVYNDGAFTDENYAWSDYKNEIKEVIILKDVTKVGNWAFAGSEELVSVIVQDGVTSFGSWAFAGCTKLNSFRYEGSSQQWQGIVLGENWNTGASFTNVQCKDGEIAS